MSAIALQEHNEHNVRDVVPLRTSHAKLTIVMPAYNEERTIEEAVRRIVEAPLPCDFELIVVDDGSTDATPEILDRIAGGPVEVVHQPANGGKGSAVLTGIGRATGTHLLVFDADLEYSAVDIAGLIEPVIRGDASVVYGVRSVDTPRGQALRYRIGNRVMTATANVLYASSIGDLHTCLKLVPVALLRGLDLSDRGFGLDTEITAKLLRQRIQPFEVPVSYAPRSRAQGKKIGWRDALQCLVILARVRFARRPECIDLVAVERSEAVERGGAGRPHSIDLVVEAAAG